METALVSAVSFYTLLVSFNWNSSPNRASLAFETSSDPNLLHAGSIAIRILARLVCEMYSDAFPTRQRVRCMRSRTSAAGTSFPDVRPRNSANSTPMVKQPLGPRLVLLQPLSFTPWLTQEISGIPIHLWWGTCIHIWPWVFLVIYSSQMRF